jgi:signal transduction histidine kinase
VIRNAVYFLNNYLGERLDETSRKHLGMIWRAAEQASNSVSDLLSFAEPQRPERVDAQVSVLVLDALSRVRIPEGIKLRTSVEAALTGLAVDPMQVVRALVNIVDNALEAMPNGGQLRIAAEADGREVAIRVSDTGQGIAPELLPSIFEPLVTTRPHAKGLGLTVARRLVESNGGRIEVESLPGKGTTFALRFPYSELRP